MEEGIRVSDKKIVSMTRGIPPVTITFIKCLVENPLPKKTTNSELAAKEAKHHKLPISVAIGITS